MINTLKTALLPLLEAFTKILVNILPPITKLVEFFAGLPGTVQTAMLGVAAAIYVAFKTGLISKMSGLDGVGAGGAGSGGGGSGRGSAAGAAAGTAALTLSLGDLVITDSDASSITSVNGTTTLLTVDNAGGAIADNAAVLLVDGGGTPAAAGSNLLRVAFTGTDTNKPTLVEVVGGSKDCIGLHVDADPTTQSAVYFTSGAALAADKATLEVVAVPTTNHADSAVVRLEQTHTAGGANILHMVQLDVDKPFLGFETTIGVGNAIEAVGGKTLTTTHFVMVDIEGVGARYMPVGTIA
jgi:hypothetical protein